MTYIDLPATCRLCLEDNGDLSLAICIVDEMELFGQFVTHFSPAHIRALAAAIKAAEDEPKPVGPDPIDYDDPSVYLEQGAIQEEQERHESP